MASINSAQRNMLADSGVDFDGGTLTLRSGASPGAGAAATGTVFATIALPSPAFGAATAGVRSKSGTWQATASASADVTSGFYGRFTSASGGRQMDLDSAAGEISIDDPNVVAGGTVTVDTATVTVPAA